MSCITDDRTLTVTLPDRDRHSFCAQLSQANIKTSTVGLHGCYHHSKHTQLAEALKKLCAANKEIRLPNAEKLRLPLRSTADTQTISTGALHEIAIDLILCKRAHWYQTVKRTVDDLSRDNVRLVPLGKDSIVPHSILLNTPSLSDGLSPNDNNPSSAKNIEEVAVVGMACRFPQADSLEEFWQLLHSVKHPLASSQLSDLIQLMSAESLGWPTFGETSSDALMHSITASLVSQVARQSLWIHSNDLPFKSPMRP